MVLISITVVDSVELLDAVSTALRSIAQKLAEGNPVQVHNVRLQIYRLIVSVIFTARKRSLGQGYIFTGVCHSVNRGGLP